MYYQNLRNFHWNVSGPNFFELHAKFEELYTAANLGIDEKAERILTLGARPFSSFTEYIDHADIKEAEEVSDSKKMVEIVRDNLSTLMKLEREVLEAASELADEGTVSLMSEYITAKEKTVWMLSAYLRQCFLRSKKPKCPVSRALSFIHSHVFQHGTKIGPGDRIPRI